MISRTWHGIVPIHMKNEFEKYEQETGIKDTTAIKGNKGAYLKIVEQGQYAHFFLCTKWDSVESMSAYAGNNPTVAVTYPEDDKYGLISDPIVIIQEVLNDENPYLLFIKEGGVGIENNRDDWRNELGKHSYIL